MNNVYADCANEDPEMKVRRGGRNINIPLCKSIVAKVRGHDQYRSRGVGVETFNGAGTTHSRRMYEIIARTVRAHPFKRAESRA